MLSRWFQVAISNTYFAAELGILFSSRPVLLLQKKDKQTGFNLLLCVSIHLHLSGKLCSSKHKKIPRMHKGISFELAE